MIYQSIFELIGPYSHSESHYTSVEALKFMCGGEETLDCVLSPDGLRFYLAVNETTLSSWQVFKRCERIFKLYLPCSIVSMLRLMFPIALKRQLPSSLIVNTNKHAFIRTKHVQTKLLAARLIWVEIPSHR